MYAEDGRNGGVGTWEYDRGYDEPRGCDGEGVVVNGSDQDPKEATDFVWAAPRDNPNVVIKAAILLSSGWYVFDPIQLEFGGGGAPVASDRSTAEQTADLNSDFSFDVSSYFSDPDGDQLTYELEGFSRDASMAIDGSGVITGRPALSDLLSDQPLTVTVTATDPSRLSASISVPIRITGERPKLESRAIECTDAPLKDIFTCDLSLYFDPPPSGQRISFEIENLDASLGLQMRGNTLAGVPQTEGTYDLRVIASTRDGYSAEQALSLRVVDEPIPEQTATLGQVFNLDLKPFFKLGNTAGTFWLQKYDGNTGFSVSRTKGDINDAPTFEDKKNSPVVITILMNKGLDRAEKQLTINVEGEDSPPVAESIPTVEFTQGKRGSFDFSKYWSSAGNFKLRFLFFMCILEMSVCLPCGDDMNLAFRTRYVFTQNNSQFVRNSTEEFEFSQNDVYIERQTQLFSGKPPWWYWL